VKLELTYDQQNQLLTALSKIDTYDVATANGEVVKVPYKFGAERRALVKNIRALQTSLSEWQEVTKSIFRECFPDVPEGVEVAAKDRPEEFAKYRFAVMESAKQKDEVDLIQFTAQVVYEDNEIPAMIAALLEERGLVHDDEPTKLRQIK
jgi:hypothetical protein